MTETVDSSEVTRVQARLADLDLVRTMVDCRAETIKPRRPISTGGRNAVESLRELGASLEGKIDLHEALGEGGMGVVHLATQATLGRRVAVKTLRESARTMDAILRILREAWVTGSLEHPNIVPIYDVGVDKDGSPVIVMKRIEGRHWGELMNAPEEIARRFGARDPLEWNLGILGSVCNAMHFAHSRGILHRDLKPENVMIGSFGEVYVLDWGIAISLREDPTGRLPSIGSVAEVAGTPQYMAPEMLLGDATKFSARTDVYLLGALLFEILANKAPHDAPDVPAMLADILVGTPRFPAGFPAEARAICERAMQRDPEDRYESAEALRRAIDEYLRHRGSLRLAEEAKESLTLLLDAVERAPAAKDRDDPMEAEDRALAVANLLGECRFGYRAALAAWPDNEAARRGLDQALLAVVGYELDLGDPHAAAIVLREVSAPPADLTRRLDVAMKARAHDDDRLRKMDTDHDPRVGTRTRFTLGAAFGALWTLSPLAAWEYERRGHVLTHAAVIAAPVVFLALGFLAFAWAKETLTKTLLNRNLADTFAVFLVAQTLLSVGTWMMGVPVAQVGLIIVTLWVLTYMLLAVWAERWFALPAATSAITFLVVAAAPHWLYPLMALDNLVFTLILVRFWFPKEELASFHVRKRLLHRRARRWLRETVTAGPASEPEE